MSALHKVVWAEGVFLGQQHFQLWEQYSDNQRAILGKSLSSFLWGFLRTRIDKEALKTGQFRLLSAEVIFPDRQIVSWDAGSDGPLVCDLGGATSERQEIFLAMPADAGVAGISGYQDKGRLCAWRASYHEVADLHDPARTREVLVGRPNLLLLRGDEPREQFVALKLAELIRQGDGAYGLVDSYVPPICRISASASLCAVLQAIVDQVGARVRALGERRLRFGGVADFGPNELSQFLLLQTLRPALVALQHLQNNPDLHPELLYRELSQLVACLIGFQPEAAIGEIPPYTHHDLTAPFARLHEQLRGLLGDVMPAQLSGLKLQRESEAMFSTHSIDGNILDNSSLFLAVLFESDNPAWIADFARQIKVGAREDIELILSSAMGGVRVTHTQRPPNRLPIKSGYEYFRIEPKGEFWTRVREHQSLALFVPGTFSAVKLELLSVDE